MRRLTSFAGFLLWTAAVNVAGHSQTIPFDSDRWEISAAESKVQAHLGRDSLYLKGGLASIKDSRFLNGIIEFDIAFSRDRSFTGVVWRMQDARNYEEFYFRPHQSGNPDANQYTPVFNGLAGWQLYYGEEYSAPVKYEFNQWMRVKIVVSGKYAEVYIKDMDKPALFVSELKRDIKPGSVGLQASNLAPAWFSNFSFTPMTNPALKGKPKQPEAAPDGTFRSWLVSAVFDEKLLSGKFELSRGDKENLRWKKLACEADGLCNLARLDGVGEGKNTVFSRGVIVSERDQIKRLRFGFSDRVKVYFNDRLVYGGDDSFQSRDYRFLGTLGYFDEVYLPLRKGSNELWIAVSENFGGWGIKAMFEDPSGIELREP